MSIRIPFVKTYFTPQELVQLLKARGMKIADEEKARHYISHIGYYRLSAYMHPLLSMPKEQHIFKQGATFDKVMMLYRFDKKLRLLLFNIWRDYQYIFKYQKQKAKLVNKIKLHDI